MFYSNSFSHFFPPLTAFVVYFVHYEKPLEAFLTSLKTTAARYLSPDFLVPRINPKSPCGGCSESQRWSDPNLQMCCFASVVGGALLPLWSIMLLRLPVNWTVSRFGQDRTSQDPTSRGHHSVYSAQRLRLLNLAQSFDKCLMFL